MGTWFGKAIFVVSAGLSILFCYAYFDAYFKRRNCFNEIGRCFDENDAVVYSQQSGLAWLSLAVLMAAIALYRLRGLKR
jgi:hypothetical protein